MSVATAPDTSRIQRGTERRLLALALLVVLGAYTLLGLSLEPRIPAGTFVFGSALAALAAIAHLTVRRYAPLADPVLLPTVFLLNGLGLVLVRRIDFAAGSELAVAQTTWMVVAIGAFALTLLIVRDHRRLTRYHYTAGLVTIALIALPLLPEPIGREVNGARLWVQIGGLSFQPGELAKLTLVVFLAGYLERKRALLSVATQRVGPFLLPPARHLAPLLVGVLAALVVLVRQNEMGTSLMLLTVLVVLLYVATGRLAYPAIGLTTFALGAVLAYRMFAHVRVRFDIWLDPWADISGAGYQIAQALFAMGTGGLTGTGLGLGRPQSIPFPATDAIFAVIGEELGLLGTTAVLVAFLVVVGRGFRIALTCRDEAGTLLVAGLTTIVAIQVFVIVGGVTRLIPLTGITLPFVSYGGSSLLSNYILLALLLRVSDQNRRSARLGPEVGA